MDIRNARKMAEQVTADELPHSRESYAVAYLRLESGARDQTFEMYKSDKKLAAQIYNVLSVENIDFPEINFEGNI